jgi:ABC-type amino acid transport system permease subunit
MLYLMTRKVLTTINIDPDQLELLRALSVETSVSMAELVRQGVAMVLKRARAFVSSE